MCFASVIFCSPALACPGRARLTDSGSERLSRLEALTRHRLEGILEDIFETTATCTSRCYRPPPSVPLTGRPCVRPSDSLLFSGSARFSETRRYAESPTPSPPNPALAVVVVCREKEFACSLQYPVTRSRDSSFWPLLSDNDEDDVDVVVGD